MIGPHPELHMNYVIVDLEATCWETGTKVSRMEIIEIGAVMLALRSFEAIDEFSEFVRPTAEPVLSDFCKELTSIRQKDVDKADPFEPVFARFLHWIGDEPYTLYSWGAYDLNQFKVECERRHMPLPEPFENHINLKALLASLTQTKQRGMKAALSMFGIPLEGRHHRGIDDARNIAQIARVMLPVVANGDAARERGEM